MTISEYFKDYNFLFDSHAHLSTGGFEVDAIPKILENSEKGEVKKIFDMGVDLKSSGLTVKRAVEDNTVLAFVGIDPEVFEPGSESFIGFDVDDKWFEEQYSSIKNLISENIKVIGGVGETGMDFYHFKNESAEIREQSTQLQERLFRTHLEIAKELKLPLSIHSRGAESYCLDIVKTFPDTFGIFHSYTGDYETAVKILDAGWGLGVNGIITFKNANDLRELYKKLIGPIPQLLIYPPQPTKPEFFYQKGIFFETDSPYLAPEGKRGEQNEPANVKMIYDKFLEILTS